VCVCVRARARAPAHAHHLKNLSCHVCGLDEGNRISGYKIFRGCDCRISESLHE
jgi:hypothetical protein